MTSYKLHYFDGRGRAEVSRFLFSIAGVKFEDYRIKREEWPNIKKNYPNGTVPALEIDGKILFNQSKAIDFYLAETFGLSGSNAIEKAQIIEISNDLEDSIKALPKIFMAKDAEEKAAGLVEYKESQQRYIAFIEKFVAPLAKNGFLIGGKLSLADIYVYVMLDTEEQLGLDLKEMLANAPTLAANRAKVATVDKVKAWIEARPKL